MVQRIMASQGTQEHPLLPKIEEEPTHCDIDTLIKALQENNRHLGDCQKTIRALSITIYTLQGNLTSAHEENQNLRKTTKLLIILSNKLDRKNKLKLLNKLERNKKFQTRFYKFLNETDEGKWGKQFFDVFYDEFERDLCPFFKCLENLCCYWFLI